MDPIVILRTVWRHRLLALPAVILMTCGAIYVLFLGPRVYQSSATYVLVNPQVPSAEQLEKSTRLARLNSNNPYLRSSDPSLIVQVMTAKLSASATAESLQASGLGPDYTVGQSAGNSLMLIITGSSSSAKGSLATTAWLSNQLQQQLITAQKVNGADDLYLFTALPVDIDTGATEKVSSRSRGLIMVCIGGAVLVFGAVSLGVALDRKKSMTASDSATTESGLAPQLAGDLGDEDASNAASRPWPTGQSEEGSEPSTSQSAQVESTAREDRQPELQRSGRQSNAGWGWGDE